MDVVLIWGMDADVVYIYTLCEIRVAQPYYMFSFMFLHPGGTSVTSFYWLMDSSQSESFKFSEGWPDLKWQYVLLVYCRLDFVG
jgi:hypothetical protein